MEFADLEARVGPKAPVQGKRAVCSSSQPTVTDVMLQVMQSGGNAADAAVAGCLVQAVVEPHMTNLAGSVLFLYWEAASGKTFQLTGSGTLVPDLAPFRPIPGIGIRFASEGHNPCACIPGFVPALGEIQRRFGSRSWADLCQPAVEVARQGHRVSSFEYGVLTEELPFTTFFPSGRELFTPNGFLPEVGEIFHNPALAQTLENCAEQGPEYFTEGDWARHFVAEANRLGWPIGLDAMTAIPPRWQEPLRYTHQQVEIIQLAPPERTGIFTAFALGVLAQMGMENPLSAEGLYRMAHVLRRADWEMGLLQDPHTHDTALDVWLSPEYHQLVARQILGSRSKVDLSNHLRLTAGNPALLAAGVPGGGAQGVRAPGGSCELSIVDAEGNWVQMMNTLQGGGIPGAVVDGVPMVGSHARARLTDDIAGWFTGGGRIKSITGSTLVLRAGKPWMGLGTPGNVYGTIPQVLAPILELGMDPVQAVDLPRMDPLRDDYVLEIESRLSPEAVLGLAQRGIQVRPLPAYDYNMGSFQMCWRDLETGLLSSYADPRRAGKAAGF